MRGRACAHPAPRRLALLLVLATLAGCGGSGAGDGVLASEADPPPEPPAPAYTRPNRPSPAPPSTPAVSRARYERALQAYCSTTTRALEALLRSAEDEEDPVRPIEVLARRYRRGLERLGRLTPPAAYRPDHLLALAGGRETADRLDDGVRLGREGDTDAATSALGELSGLLPTLPPALLRAAPACAPARG